VAGLIEECIAENARIAPDQGEYQKRYDSLAKRFDRTKTASKPWSGRLRKSRLIVNVEQFLSELAKQDAVTEFTDELWYSMIDHVKFTARTTSDYISETAQKSGCKHSALRFPAEGLFLSCEPFSENEPLHKNDNLPRVGKIKRIE
jgi:hypothetical protein